MTGSTAAGAALLAALLAQPSLPDGLPALPASPLLRWLVVGALALVAVYLLVTAVRCAFRLVGLAVLVVVAWLAWRWFA